MNLLDELKLMIYESNLDEEEMNLCLDAVEECTTEDEFFETADDVLCLMEARTVSDESYADIGKEINSNLIRKSREKNPLYGTQYERMSDAEKRKRDLKVAASDSNSDFAAPQKMIARKRNSGFNTSLAKLNNGDFVFSDSLRTKKDEAQLKKYAQQEKKLNTYRNDVQDSMDSLLNVKNNKEINKIIKSRRASGKKTYDVRDIDTYKKKMKYIDDEYSKLSHKKSISKIQKRMLV